MSQRPDNSGMWKPRAVIVVCVLIALLALGPCRSHVLGQGPYRPLACLRDYGVVSVTPRGRAPLETDAVNVLLEVEGTPLEADYAVSGWHVGGEPVALRWCGAYDVDLVGGGPIDAVIAVGCGEAPGTRYVVAAVRGRGWHGCGAGAVETGALP